MDGDLTSGIAVATAPADARAARGFNGDLGQHLWRWRQGLESGTVAADLLGVRVARKALLAVAGLVSVHDHTWTTDRSRAVQRWSELEPGLAAQLGRLLSWAKAELRPSREKVGRAVADDGIVAAIVERFGRLIGLWTDRIGTVRGLRASSQPSAPWASVRPPLVSTSRMAPSRASSSGAGSPSVKYPIQDAPPGPRTSPAGSRDAAWYFCRHPGPGPGRPASGRSRAPQS